MQYRDNAVFLCFVESRGPQMVLEHEQMGVIAIHA